MLKKYRRILLFLIFLLSTGILFYITLSFPPDHTVSLLFFPLSLVPVFFMLFIISVFSLITTLFKRPIFGGLVSGFVTVFLLLRMAGLTHPFFLFLLIALFITLLLLLKKEKTT